MLYKVSELAQFLSIPERTLRDWLIAGAPHSRDQRNHLWIHGREFAGWVVNLRKERKQRKLRQGEAFCLRCNQPVAMTDVSTHNKQGKFVLKRGKCPICGGRICRGGRISTNSTSNPAFQEKHNGN